MGSKFGPEGCSFRPKAGPDGRKGIPGLDPRFAVFWPKAGLEGCSFPAEGRARGLERDPKFGPQGSRIPAEDGT